MRVTFLRTAFLCLSFISCSLTSAAALSAETQPAEVAADADSQEPTTAEGCYEQAKANINTLRTPQGRESVAELLNQGLTLNQKGLDFQPGEGLRVRLMEQRFQLFNMKWFLVDGASAQPDYLAFLEAATKDPNSRIVSHAYTGKLVLMKKELLTATPEEQADLLDRMVSVVTRQEPNALTLNQIALLRKPLEAHPRAAEHYQALGDFVLQSDDEKIAAKGAGFEAFAKRIRMRGRPVDMAGTTVEGRDFDLASLKGKVVLVDFWATTCGPCIREFPALQKLRDAYQPHGFEIVGICTDSDREKLEKILASKNVSWITLFDESVVGFDHPLALKYGIIYQPYKLLVDRDGHLVADSGRLDEICARLYKLFPDVESPQLKESPAAAAAN